MNQKQMPLYVQFPEQDQYCPEVPPMRIMVALQFLQSVTVKRMPRICPMGEYKYEVIKGLSLTPTEINAEKTAHDLLIDYFRGELKPDWREKMEIDEFEAEAKESENTPRPAVRCPQCNPGSPEANCYYCDGSGWSMIGPAKRPQK